MPRPRRRGGWRRRFPWPGTRSTSRAETVRPRIQSGAGCHRGGLRLPTRPENAPVRDRPANRVGFGRRAAVAARRYRTTTVRQAGETEAGGVLAPDQVLAPAVLAEAEQDSGIGDAGAVVGDGDGETGLAARIDRRACRRRSAPTVASARRREFCNVSVMHIGESVAGVNPRDALQRVVVDAGADIRRRRSGNLVHAGSSPKDAERETPRRTAVRRGA